MASSYGSAESASEDEESLRLRKYSTLSESGYESFLTASAESQRSSNSSGYGSSISENATPLKYTSRSPDYDADNDNSLSPRKPTSKFPSILNSTVGQVDVNSPSDNKLRS